MADPVGAVVGVIGLATSVLGVGNTYSQQKKAKKKTKKADERAQENAELNAQNVEAEAAEAMRRKEFDKKTAASSLRAKLASTGIRGNSPQAYISAFLAERDKEIEWIKTSGVSRADAVRRNYTSPYNPGASTTQLLSGLSSAATSGYKWYEQYVK